MICKHKLKIIGFVQKLDKSFLYISKKCEIVFGKIFVFLHFALC